MPATSITEENKPENVVDDVSNTEVKSEDQVDLGKLAALRAKNQAKQQENSKMAAKIVSKKERSLVIGVLGSGQAGSRLA